MAYLASTETVDTASSDGTCLYGPQALGGTPIETTVKVNDETLEIIAGTPFYECDDISDIEKINPLSPLPCQPGTRRLTPTVNTTVYINGKLPAVTGDDAQLVIGGSPRPLTGPFQHPTIVIGSRLTS